MKSSAVLLLIARRLRALVRLTCPANCFEGAEALLTSAGVARTVTDAVGPHCAQRHANEQTPVLPEIWPAHQSWESVIRVLSPEYGVPQGFLNSSA